MRTADPCRLDRAHGSVLNHLYHHQVAPPEAPQADPDLRQLRHGDDWRARGQRGGYDDAHHGGP